MNQQTWWELHLRKARGETLSADDERAYQEPNWPARKNRLLPSLSTLPP